MAQARTAVGLTGVVAALWVVLIGTEAALPLWMLLGLVAAAAAVSAWRAGGPPPRRKPALASLVVDELVLATLTAVVIVQL